GITCSIVGKGPENLRLVECEKTSDENLSLIKVERAIEFDFRGKKYRVDVGEAIFSKTELDEGTKFLLEVFFEKEIDLNNKEVADFGAGWGAISLILANEFPKSRITALEKDKPSFEAARNNLKNFSNISAINADLTKINSAIFLEKKGGLDYIISNPPLHSTPKDKELIFENAFNLLKRKGKLFFVAENSFAPRFRKIAQNFFTFIEQKENDSYTTFWYYKK
ncbi:MAG TPA: methyltransferase, partial [Candidatus Paceibacterota bacterium]